MANTRTDVVYDGEMQGGGCYHHAKTPKEVFKVVREPSFLRRPADEQGFTVDLGAQAKPKNGIVRLMLPVMDDMDQEPFLAATECRMDKKGRVYNPDGKERFILTDEYGPDRYVFTVPRDSLRRAGTQMAFKPEEVLLASFFPEYPLHRWLPGYKNGDSNSRELSNLQVTRKWPLVYPGIGKVTSSSKYESYFVTAMGKVYMFALKKARYVTLPLKNVNAVSRRPVVRIQNCKLHADRCRAAAKFKDCKLYVDRCIVHSIWSKVKPDDVIYKLNGSLTENAIWNLQVSKNGEFKGFQKRVAIQGKN